MFHHRSFRILVAGTAVVFAAGRAGTAIAQPLPDWVAPMQAVNAGFTGTDFYAGKVGDSIYQSGFFWAPLAGPDLDLAGNPWDEEVAALNGVLIGGAPAPEYDSPATQVGRGTAWLLGGTPSPLDQLLAQEPEVALVLVGMNDIFGTDSSGLVIPSFEPNYRAIVQTILAADCIPLLTTIPPQRDRELLVEQANSSIRTIADSLGVPLHDYHAEVLARQPASWDGTLIAADGIHPSSDPGAPGSGAGDFTPTNLDVNGYALLNHGNLDLFSRIYDLVLSPLPVDAPWPPVSPADRISLSPVVPTPVRSGATVRFSLPRAGAARLTVHDVAGRRIATLVDGPRPAGVHEVPWPRAGRDGRRPAAGVYYLRLSVDGESVARAVPVLR